MLSPGLSSGAAVQTPYAAKIAFGLIELASLAAWLAFAGRRRKLSALQAAAAPLDATKAR